MSGAPGKVPLEEFLVDGDVLDGDETAARLVLGDRVDEHRRIPVAQPVEEDGDVDHAPYGLGAGDAGRSRLGCRRGRPSAAALGAAADAVGRVEALDRFERQIEAGISRNDAGVRRAEEHLQPLFQRPSG